jgi:putative nucleotidyltransferase with HDIG domain
LNILEATLIRHRSNPEWRVGLFAGGLGCVAVAIGAMLVMRDPRIDSWWVVLVLAVVAAFAERGTVLLGKDTEQSISLVPTLFAAVLFGPLASMLVAAASMVGEFTRREAWQFDRPVLRLLVYTHSRLITGAVAGLVAQEIVGSHAGQMSRVVAATTAAALAAESLDALIASITLHLRGRHKTLAALWSFAPVLGLSVALYTPVVAMLGFAYQSISPWTLPLFLVPALAAQRLFGLYQQQRDLAETLAEANDRLERANLSFATALVATLDARDRYTAGHSAAVAVYSRDIAARMGLNSEQQQLAHLCGLVHDIGKIGLPPGLLEKPGALTLEERRQMQEHSAIGERILANVEDYAEIATIVRHHHERIDGQGYPDGLSLDDIPLLSRIIAVADAYNAMTSDRPYRDAMPSRVARLRLAQAVDGQFDTSVVAAFEALLATADESYRLATRSDFIFESQELSRAVSEAAVA